MEALLSWGAEVDPQDYGGFSPLYVACSEGNLLCVLALLKAGDSVTFPNDVGCVPIHAAALYNRVEVVRTLLERGCSPDMVSRLHIEQTINSSPFLHSSTARRG